VSLAGRIGLAAWVVNHQRCDRYKRGGGRNLNSDPCEGKSIMKSIMTRKPSSAAVLMRCGLMLAIATAFIARGFAQDSVVDDAMWARIDTRTLNTLPPAFILRPTHFAGTGSAAGGGMAKAGDKMVGRAISFAGLMSLAYDVDLIQVVAPPDQPAGGFDLLMTTPDASREKLQQEISRRFGYVAHTERRVTDVLLLQSRLGSAPGLKPGQGGRGGRVNSSSSSGAGAGVRSRKVAVQNQPVSVFIKNLQSSFERPLLDRTGLTGNYDFTLEVALGSGGSESDAIKRALPVQLGLELVPSRQQLELLVVRKAK
jgi:uncharacterized protein (TIGR03435 family)